MVAKVMQLLIYMGTTSATNKGDVIRPVATKDHSSNERLPSSACCYYDPYIYSVILK
jgi:hypothetical protein